jgi:hypothetical protein
LLDLKRMTSWNLWCSLHFVLQEMQDWNKLYCTFLMAHRSALSFFQNPAPDHKSNLHTVWIYIWFYSPLKLQNGCGLDLRIYSIYLWENHMQVSRTEETTHKHNNHPKESNHAIW